MSDPEERKRDLKNLIQVVNSETKEDEKTSNKKEMENFWNKRKLEACGWGILVTLSNFTYQMNTILNPKTEEGRFIASLYMIGSVMSTLSFILFFKKKADTIYLTMLYLTFRNLMRIIDFE